VQYFRSCKNHCGCQQGGHLYFYSIVRFNKIRDKIKALLRQVGWPKIFVDSQVPIIPISALTGENVMKKSLQMPWFEGCEVDVKMGPLDELKKCRVHTLIEAIECLSCGIQLPLAQPLRVSISNVYQRIGVIAGRVERGIVHVGDIVTFLP
jgi:elongation factor 1-alpha